MKKLLILLTIIVLLNPSVASAQKDTHDTTYYTSYPHSLTARIYFTQNMQVLNSYRRTMQRTYGISKRKTWIWDRCYLQQSYFKSCLRFEFFE